MNSEEKNKFTKMIRIALVGCGRISHNHIKAILLHEDKAKLIAICDTDRKKIDDAKNVLREYKNDKIDSFLSVFYDYGDLLNAIKEKKIDIDLIVLCTPSGLHSKQATSALRNGIHVCTEKPMATKWIDGINMVKTASKFKKKLFVVKQNRFNPTLQLLKKQLNKGRFGKIVLVNINVFWHRPQSYYNQAKWRGTWELDGGALMNQASHYVDLLHWLIGPVDSISASIATLGREIEAEDTAAIQLKWGNGALGTMAVTMLTYPKNLEGSITILGEKGTVKIGGNAVNEIKHWEFEDSSLDDNDIQESSYKTTSIYGFGHPLYYENLFNCLLNDEKAICDGEEGLKSLELLIAAYRSAKSKMLIKLPLKELLE